VANTGTLPARLNRGEAVLGMNAKMTAVLGSYIAREAVLAPALVACNHAELTGLVTDVQGKLGAFNEQAQAQSEPTEGKTAECGELLDRMIAIALDVANAVAAYADKQGLTDLAAQVAVAQTDFKRLRKLQRPWLGQRIHDVGASVIDHLAEYEVTTETLTALQEAIDAVHAGLKEPKRTIVSKKVATQNLDTLFQETAALFEQIDRVLFALRKKHPALYAAYHAAAVIVDPPRRPRARAARRAAVAVVTPGAEAPQGDNLAA
jgi:hypothetical protein